MRSPFLWEMFPLMTQPGGGEAQPWGQAPSWTEGEGEASGGTGRRGSEWGEEAGSGSGVAGGLVPRGRRSTAATSRRARRSQSFGVLNLGLLRQRWTRCATFLIPTVPI
jgi:hypothetical protein